VCNIFVKNYQTAYVSFHGACASVRIATISKHLQQTYDWSVNFCCRNFRLTVNVPPSISGPNIVNKTANLGSSVTLMCDVYAVPKATITWIKDGTTLRFSDRRSFRAGGTMLLISESQSSFE